MGQEKGNLTSSTYDPSLDLPVRSSLTESSFTPLDLLNCIDVKFNDLKTGKTFNLFRSFFFPSPDSHLLLRPPFLPRGMNSAFFFIYHADATISKKTLGDTSLSMEASDNQAIIKRLLPPALIGGIAFTLFLCYKSLRWI